MKVLLFAEWFANLGGSETFNKVLFLELNKKGVDTLLVTREKEATIHPSWKAELSGLQEKVVVLNGRVLNRRGPYVYNMYKACE